MAMANQMKARWLMLVACMAGFAAVAELIVLNSHSGERVLSGEAFELLGPGDAEPEQ